MSNHCKIEFYFKRKDIEKLLAENPDAKGIIIRQEIKPRKTADNKSYINVTTISAYTSLKTESLEKTGGDDEVYGCPIPPGCIDNTLNKF